MVSAQRREGEAVKDMYSNDDNWEWRAELYIDAANVASRAAAKEFKPLLIAWLSRLGTGYDRVRKCECGAEDHAPEVKP